MKRSYVFANVALLAALIVPSPGFAGIEKLLGKWAAKAETPNGPVEIEFDLKQEGNQLVGTAALMQGSVPLSAIRFEDPVLSVEMALGNMSFKLQGTLSDDKFSGTWEQVGGDVKGTWTAERRAAAAVPLAAAAGAAGSWAVVAATPQGDLPFTMEIREQGGKIAGTLSSAGGSIEIQSAFVSGGKLGFDIDMGGAVYHVEGDIAGDKFVGKWGPAGGGEGGAVTGSRQPAPAVAAAPEVPIEGDWGCTAVSPDGELPFTLTISRATDSLKGTVSTGEGSMPAQKVSFAAGTLSFEVEYAGGIYRIEAKQTGSRLSGKWSAVSGSDSGGFSAERKNP